MFTLLHRRSDDTFVIEHLGYPYHVIQSDPMYAAVAEAAVGVVLEPEPGPPASVVLPTPPQPTRAELMAQLLRLQAQIEALP